MNVLGYQLAKGIFLFLFSYVLLVDLPDPNFLANLGNTLLAICSVDGQNINFLCGTFLCSLVMVSVFGISYIIRNKEPEDSASKSITDPLPPVGFDDLIGKTGKVKSINSDRFISIDGKLYKYLTENGEERALGRSYVVWKIKGDKLII